jgi:predicted SprT family Zn-dependent metalloprotease
MYCGQVEKVLQTRRDHYRPGFGTENVPSGTVRQQWHSYQCACGKIYQFAEPAETAFFCGVCTREITVE